MSNLNNLDSAASMLKSHMKKQPTNKTITDLIASKGETETNLCLLESLMNDLYLNDLKHDYLKLNNEPIMTILKIKKRNKASLFNLILPPALSYIASSSTSTTTKAQGTPINSNCTNDALKLDTFKSTTPWLSKEKSSLYSMATDTDLLANNENNNNDNNSNKQQDIDSSSSTSSTSSSSLDCPVNQNDKLENDFINNNSNDDIMVDNLIEYDYNEGCRR